MLFKSLSRKNKNPYLYLSSQIKYQCITILCFVLTDSSFYDLFLLCVANHLLYFLFSLKEADAGPGVFLECDSTIKDSILRHLKMYKLRRKVNINPCPELSVWAVLSKQKKAGQEAGKPELSSPDKALVWEADPRTQEMGWRLVLDSQDNPLDIIASCEKGDTVDYQRHRYAIGKVG